MMPPQADARTDYQQLPLPIAMTDVLHAIVRPAYAYLPRKMDNVAASVMLLAIGLQESGFAARRQRGGPAVGLWQFERGGISGVLRHRSTAAYARDLCERRGVMPTLAAVYAALPNDDVLAAGFARLLLWTDPRHLPAFGNVDAAWHLYADPKRTWSPGRPRREHWRANYGKALTEVMSDGS